MIIKNYINKIADFIIKRLAELIGLFFIAASVLLFISLISYSPEDPNFIFPENQSISNILGLKGSFVADIFFQSVGIVSLLIPFSLFFTGLSITMNKKLVLLIENIFFIIIYTILATFFFGIFHQETHWLLINGNDGFVGDLMSETIIADMLNINKKISYYLLLFFIFIFFLLSSNFKASHILKCFIIIKNFFSTKRNISMSSADSGQFNETTENSKKEIIQEDLFTNKQRESTNELKIKLPLIDFLKTPDKLPNKLDETRIDADGLEKILLDFGVQGKIKKISHGPVVSLNEFEPAAGVKVSKIINLSEDIARNTSSESARIATIPGSNTVGIELPKISRENVFLREIISDKNYKKKDIKLPIALGKSISGEPITSDLSSMPHLLIAGTTGSGKSVCINTIILSLIYKHTPEICKFILIDPKMLELSTYEGIPHLLCPITEAKKAASVLGWVVKEMESRYRLSIRVGVRNIDGYNEKHKVKMPYIVVIVDEMSDLMLVAGRDENYIQKLSQMARAAGIHIIMATQRPSVDVITVR